MVTLSTNLIKKLYYSEGLSTIEIGKKLKISHWVVLRFMKRMNLPRRTMKEANAKKFEKKKPSYSLKNKLSDDEQKLKIAGAMLYWAEGGRSLGKYCVVDFANSDAEMVKIFLSFLRNICGINEKRLRVQLYC